jgi:hypothetical protein
VVMFVCSIGVGTRRSEQPHADGGVRSSDGGAAPSFGLLRERPSLVAGWRRWKVGETRLGWFLATGSDAESFADQATAARCASVGE